MTPTNCPVSDSSTSESRPSGRPSLKSHLPVEDERVQTLHFFQKAKAASSNVKAVDATPEWKTIGPDGSPKRARPVDPRGVGARPPPPSMYPRRRTCSSSRQPPPLAHSKAGSTVSGTTTRSRATGLRFASSRSVDGRAVTCAQR